MNARAAIAETMETLRSGKWDDGRAISGHVDHCYEMEEKINADPTMSIGKLNRWLGWIQCTLCLCTCATLGEMKQINRKHAND